MKEKGYKKICFTIDGTWFTWMLRHLWIEGSELKAINIWGGAFPHLMKIEHLKGIFLDVVIGKKKFTGDSTEGFKLLKDGTKYWSHHAGGKPDRSWPLLQSWEDVILRKRAQLFISELELRAFRYYRRGPQTWKEANYNSMTWMLGAKENETENRILLETGKMWTEIMNLGKSLKFDVEGFMIPIEMKGWSTLHMKSKTDSWTVQTTLGTALYQNIMKVLEPIQNYFKEKYGSELIFIDENWIKEFICNIHPYEEDAIMRLKTREERTNELIEKAQAMAPKSNLSSLGSMDVDRYISQRMKAGKTPKEEDPFKTDWDSGYIDREGKFYGCPDLDHLNFAGDLVEHLEIKYKPRKEPDDLQYVLDDKGWVKVSARRFYFDKKPNEKQIDVIGLFMTGKGMRKALFNVQFGDGITFEKFSKGF